METRLKTGVPARVLGALGGLASGLGRLALAMATPGRVGQEFDHFDERLSESRSLVRTHQEIVRKQLTKLGFDRALTQLKHFDTLSRELWDNHGAGEVSTLMTVYRLRSIAESVRAGLVTNLEYIVDEIGDEFNSVDELSTDLQTLLNINDEILKAMFDAVEAHIETPVSGERWEIENRVVAKFEARVSALHKRTADAMGV